MATRSRLVWLVLFAAVAVFTSDSVPSVAAQVTPTPTDTPTPTTATPTDTPTPTSTTATPMVTPTPSTATPTPTTATPTPTTATPTPTTATPTPTTATPTPTTATPTPTPITAAPTPIPTTATPTPAPTPAPTCGPRVRRAWSVLSSSDKQLYIDAISAAMSSGYHALFVEVHTDTVSSNESFRTCAMIYWHRRFILAYENMLRSLDPRFACITIPYWNYFADYAKKAAGLCTTLQGCSQFLQDIGGSSGPTGTIFINGIPTLGNLVNSTSFAPFSNYCESSTLASSSCAKAMPRGSWNTTVFPSGFGYASMARILSGSYGFSWFSQNVHYGVHNSIHNSAAGAMWNYGMAAEPIFFNHHAMVDYLHQMFYNCQVGRNMTTTEKQTSSYAFQQCIMTATDVCPTVMSNVTQYWNVAGSTRTRAEDHPLLAPFFAPLPTQYWNYVDGTDLGNYSYSYEADDLVSMLTASGLSCPQNKIRRRMQDISMTAKHEAIVNGMQAFEAVYDASYSQTGSHDAALLQSEIIECSFYNVQNNGTDDLDPLYKATMGIPSSRHTVCYKHMMELASGTTNIQVSNWRNIISSRLDVAVKATALTTAVVTTVNPTTTTTTTSTATTSVDNVNLSTGLAN